MDRKQFINILKKYQSGTASPEERRFIEAYYDLFEAAEDGFTEDGSMEDEMLNDMWIRLRESQKRRGIKIKSLPPRSIKMAAIVLVLVMLGGGLAYLAVHYSQSNTGNSGIVVSHQTDSILPGEDKAVLTLANGNQVVLDSLQMGSSMQQGNVRISKLGNGRLVYKPVSPTVSSGNIQQPVQYNTLRTPKGGQYQVELPDGSQVWLNAESSIRFPTVFAGNSRTVEINGEVYFEVAKKIDQPFIVNADRIRIEVLGTHFNVDAYNEKKAIETTLSEGAVRVAKKNDKGEMQYVELKPGQQASLDRSGGELQVKAVNLDAVLAWKNGLFYFDNTNIKAIMNEIARWYNVSVAYETTDLADKNFSGVVSRYSDVDALLKRLELTGTVHFRIENRTIIVTE